MKRRLLLASTIAVVLSACSSSNDDSASSAGESAKTGVAASALLAGEDLLTVPFTRPTSVLGVYVTSFLSTNATAQVRSALDGVQAQLQLYFGQQADSATSAAVIEQLGTTLQVDVKELLNRATDRGEALEEYTEFLETASVEARAVFDDLDAQRENTEERLSTERKEASTLKREVSRAISDKDFSLAGAKQELLNATQADVAVLQSERDQLRDTQNLIRRLLEIAEERLTAITANRDALVAGIAVVDLPGAEDLGVLLEGARGRQNGLGAPFEGL